MARFMLGPEKEANCCYYGTVYEFLQETYSPDEWADRMQASMNFVYRMDVGRAQMESWKDCYSVCKEQLINLDAKYKNMNIIFEFGLKEYHDKRPDVVFVADNFVLVAEFKRKNTGLKADIDQAAKYGVKLADGHLGSRNKKVFRMLVDTRAKKGTWEWINERHLLRVSADLFGRGIKGFLKNREINNSESILAWMDADFLDRPDVVQGSIDVFNGGNIGDIRPVLTPELQDEFERRKRYLIEKAHYARENKKFVLATLTGVPGAGKTYMGVSFIYGSCEDVNEPDSVYVSGNGPLVSVLQENLRHDEHETPFVRPVHDILYRYIRDGSTIQRNIIAFDEGQRAWNIEKMAQKYKRYGHNKSEPETIINMIEQENKWCFLLLLVGDGQEIHSGENTDLKQWNDAINSAKNRWTIICSNNANDEACSTFHGHNIASIERNDLLYMDKSIRTEQAKGTSLFINSLLDGDLATASQMIKNGKLYDYNIYITRELEKAKSYCRDFYIDNDRKQYGFLASSKGSELRNFGMDNSYEGTHDLGDIIDGEQKYVDIDYAKWYSGNSQSPPDDEICCNFNKVVTEFGCQGLEMDMAIVGWDTDMTWYNGMWHPWGKDDTEKAYRKNSYRVLLTRGRDGVVIYLPRHWKFNKTYDMLKDQVGIPELKN